VACVTPARLVGPTGTTERSELELAPVIRSARKSHPSSLILATHEFDLEDTVYNQMDLRGDRYSTSGANSGI